MNKTNKDKGLFLRGNIWWTKIRGIRDSTGTSDLKEATRILAVRKGKVAEGRTLLQRVDQIRFPEAKADLLSWYETYNTRDLGEATRRFKHIDPFFKRRRLVEIMPALITGYVGKRRKDGASDGTIYVEIATIRKLLTVAYENNKLDRRPIIHNIEVNNTRSGFFEREEFEEVREYLPPHIQLAITIQYLVGWRTREVLKLEWRQIDFEAGTIRLDAGTTKNKEGRIVYMTPELKMMFLEQRERVKALQRNTGQVIPYVFCHLGGEKWSGKRIGEFRKSWMKACQEAGCPGMKLHDFRRTAVRNMVRQGVHERVAMTITGHKTRAVLNRYNIVSDADLQEVSRKLSGTIEGTVGTGSQGKP